MLIREQIARLSGAGDLRVFHSKVAWGSEARALLLCRPAQTAMDNALQSENHETVARYRALEADLTTFVDEGYVNWGLMKWLDPHQHEIWEIKSVRPNPSLRVFGRFAEPNVFVATHIVERAPLKRKFSIEWSLEMVTCEQEWDALFSVAPFHAANYEEYITTNASKLVRISR